MFSKLGGRAGFEKMRDSACLSWESYRVASCASKRAMEKQNTHDDTEKKRCHMQRSVIPRSVAYTSMQAEGASLFFHGCCSVVGFACRQAGHFGPTLVTERRPVGNAAGAPTAAGGACSWQEPWRGTAKGEATEVRAGGSVGGLQAAARLFLYLGRRAG